ncbi:hypothetical protein JTB14_028313 [Gonioctena quinquepunctata]|nr:hypothetical protein JTB14_028313 [Gonioctena quinquepunctata]
MSEWDEGKILNLIELYREKPVIWDSKNKDYYKKHLKLDAWEEIGSAMGTSGDECKRKIINILSSWRRERAKERKSVGTGKDEVYESRWFAYSALRFLIDRDVPSKGMNTQVNTSNEVTYDNANTEASTSNSVEPSPKKSKLDPKLQVLKEAFGILKSAAEQLKDDNPELRSFCDFIYQKMKNYNKQTMNSVQQEIMQIIFHADQTNYDFENCYGNLPETTDIDIKHNIIGGD